MNTRLLSIVLVMVGSIALSACGGGGSSSSAAAPTSATTAPIASGTSNQLADSVSVSGYSALSIAAKTSGSVQTAGIKGLF